MYTTTNMRCACRDADYDTEAVMVLAGEACAGLCGEALPAETADMVMLPRTLITAQSYAYGFCPDEALQRGTMFPELVG